MHYYYTEKVHIRIYNTLTNLALEIQEDEVD